MNVGIVKKLAVIFDVRGRRRALQLGFMMLIGAALEAFGIGLVFPFMALLSEPSTVLSNRYLYAAYDMLGMRSPEQFLLMASVALVVVFVAKNGYLALLTHFQFRFVYDQQVRLARALYERYLKSPYAVLVHRNSSELVNAMTVEASRVLTAVVLPACIIVIETSVVLFIVIILLLVDPVVTVSALSVVGLLLAIVYAILRPALRTAGQRRADNSARMIRWINQGLGSLKETKIFGREQFFLDAFRATSSEYARASRLFAFVNASPRWIIESIAIGGILVVVMVMLVKGGRLQHAVPVLALFAVAAVRIMPSASRLFSAVASIRFYLPSVDIIYQDLQQMPITRVGQHKGDIGASRSARILNKTLELREVAYTYDGQERAAVEDITLVIQRGTSAGIVGPSGAGKTTLVDLMLGLFTPTKGEILVDGHSLTSIRPNWLHVVGYVPQAIYLLDDTVRRNVAFGIPDNQIDEDHIWSSLRQARLQDFVDDLPGGLDAVVGERGARISGGERQRIGIARALYHDPEVLVFDEATSALDGRTEQDIADTVSALSANKTVVMIAHRINTVRRCGTLFFLKNGRLIDSGTFAQLMARNVEFRELVGDIPEDVVKLDAANGTSVSR